MERRGFIGALVTGLAAAFIPATASASEQTTLTFSRRISLVGGRYVEDVMVDLPKRLASEIQDAVWMLNTSHSRIHARPLWLQDVGPTTRVWVRFAAHDGSRLPKCDLTLWANVTGAWG